MHDARGKLLNVGDMVLVPCRVAQLYAGEDYCNLDLETQIGRRPDDLTEVIHAINTGCVLKIAMED